MRMFDWKRFETIRRDLRDELYTTPRPDLVFAKALTRENSLGLWGIRDAAKRPVAIVANNGRADESFSIAIRGEFVNVTVKPGAMAVYIAPDFRFWTFLQDPPYRISLAAESVGYNQPPQPGFYFGTDLKGHGIDFRGLP